MWRAETHFLVLGAASVDYGVLRGHLWPLDTCLSEPISGMTEPDQDTLAPWHAALDRLLARIMERAGNSAGSAWRGRAALRVLVSERWFAAAVLPWSSALLSETAARAYVRDQLQAAGFEVEPNATLHTDDLGYGQPRLAVAYPRELIDALSAAAARLGCRLDAVLPLGVAAWWSVRGALVRAGGLLAVLENEGLMLLQGQAGQIRAVFEAASGDDPLASLRAAWQRLRVRDPAVGEKGTLHVLDLAARDKPLSLDGKAMRALNLPGSDLERALMPSLRLAGGVRRIRHALDAVEGGVRASVLTWGAVAAAGFVAVMMAQQWYEAGSAVRKGEQALKERVAVQTPAPAAKPSREELAHTHAVAAAVRALNLPVDDLLAAMIPPRDIRAAVLGLTIEAGKPEQEREAGGSTLKLNAEARTGIEMARYVAYLNERPAFSTAYLVRHEVAENQPARPYRFTVEVVWRE